MDNNLISATEIVSEIEKLLVKLKQSINFEFDYVIPCTEVLIKDEIIFFYDKSLIKVGQKEIYLTKKQKYLVNALVNSKEYTAPFEFLCDKVYGYYDKAAVDALNTAVYRLRKKLNENIQIDLVRGYGYRLNVK